MVAAETRRSVSLLPILVEDGASASFAATLENQVVKELDAEPRISVSRGKTSGAAMKRLKTEGFNLQTCRELFPRSSADFVFCVSLSTKKAGKNDIHTIEIRVYDVKRKSYNETTRYATAAPDDDGIFERLAILAVEYLVPLIVYPDGDKETKSSTALFRAIQANDLAGAEKALNAGANPNQGRTTFLRTLSSDNTIIREDSIPVYPIFDILDSKTIPQNDKPAFIELLTRHDADFNIRNHNNETPLEHLFAPYAPKEARADIAQALLKGGANPNADVGTFAWSILQIAILDQGIKIPRERLALITALLDHGALLEHENKEGETPLFTAVSKGDSAVISLLLRRGANIHHRSKRGRAALEFITGSQDTSTTIALLRLLIESGAEYRGKDSPVWRYGTDEKNIPVLDYLISIGADINVANEDGRTPTDFAWENNKTVYKYLVSKGGKRFGFKFPSKNDSPACVAVFSKEAPAIRAFRKEEFSLLQARTSDGVPATVLHLAVEQGDLAFLREIAAVPETWDVPDRFRRTPLLIAVSRGRTDIAELLLRYRADPNLPDDTGMTAYSRAAGMDAKTLALLLQLGPPPKNTDPMFVAVMSGDIARVKALVKPLRGECASRANDLIDLAADFGHVDVAKYLSKEFSASISAPAEPLARAEANRRRFSDYEKGGLATRAIEKKDGGIADKRGSFTHGMEEWSPWKETESDFSLSDHPVSFFVPRDYDPSKEYGLLVFFSWNLPSESYRKVLERKRIIWVGFDCYKISYAPLSKDRHHETLALAMAYNAMRHFNIDPRRVYLAGMSWGGRLSGRITSRYPNVFTGAIATAGCQVDNWDNESKQFHDSLWYAQKNLAFAITTGDYDFNKNEAFTMRSQLLDRHFESVLYIQESDKYHEGLSAEKLEEAIDFLDECAAATHTKKGRRVKDGQP